jgi:DNA-binding HxlR family transcriptional regulator
MFDYGEFCPISMATSLLCERWTLQIIREMVLGATRFSEFQRHMPRLSPSLLNSRLRLLEGEGIVVRKRIPGLRTHEYQLTPKGKAVEPILTELGKWGMYWAHTGMSDDQLNAATLIRDIAAAIDTSQLPAGSSVIQINISDLGDAARHFIRIDGKCPEACELDSGHDVDVYVTGTLRTLTEIWYGDLALKAAMASGKLKVVGSPAYARSVSSWFRISTYSRYNRNFLEGERQATRN